MGNDWGTVTTLPRFFMALLLLTVGQVQVSVYPMQLMECSVTPFVTSTPVSPCVAFITFQREMGSKESEAGRGVHRPPPCPGEVMRGCEPDVPLLKGTTVLGNLDRRINGRSLSQGLCSCEVSEIISNGGAEIFTIGKPKQRTSAMHFIDISGGI